MGIINRFLLFVFALFLVMLSLAVLAMCLQIVPEHYWLNELRFALGRTETIAVSAAAFFPAVFHYPYRSMLVWLPITTCIAIGVTVASAVILIFSYLFRCLSRR